MSHIEIINVRPETAIHDNRGEDDLRSQIITGLSQSTGHKWLPTMLLYDERGLRLYDNITTKAPEYYLFSAEEEILKDHADQIVDAMHAHEGGQASEDEIVVELGAGALRKTSHILQALARSVSASHTIPPIAYYALDLEKSELDRTLTQLASSDVGVSIEGRVSTRGLCGTYDDGLAFIKEGGLYKHIDTADISSASPEKYPFVEDARDASPNAASSGSGQEVDITPPSTPGSPQIGPLHLIFLGSSLGNFPRGQDASFLRSLPLRPGSSDTLLLGLDHANEATKIEAAYDDPKGVTKSFIMNGLKGVGRTLGDENLLDQSKWEYESRYNVIERRHEAYYKSIGDQQIKDPLTNNIFSFRAGELVRVEVSYKYSDADAYTLFTDAKLRPIQRWTDTTSQYSLWLLERPAFMFPLLAQHLTRGLQTVIDDPKPEYNFGMPTVQEWRDMWAAWDYITQRMIPPSMLHQKPIDLRHICLFYLGHIPAFLSIHLSRLFQEPDTEPVEFKYIFERGIDPNVDDPTQCHPHSETPQRDEDWPSVGAILMFQSRVRERLLKLYDNISSGQIVLTRKIARVLFMTLEHEAWHAETLLYMLLQRAGTGTIPPTGFSPPRWAALASAWDSAPQPRSPTVVLGPATISIGHDDDETDDFSTDVEGHAFGWDNEHPKRDVHVGQFRIEWQPISNGEFFDFYNGSGKGKVQFPASWIEIDGDVHVRTLYGPVHMKIARRWPIVTSYQNLSTYASVKGGRIPTEPELRLFHDKFDCGYEGGSNVGFRNWHPVPATTGSTGDGKGHNGGVWEWTSTLLEKYDGFVPSKLYPGYSTDFFDGCHQVVIGGSYTTIPRLSERRTVRNYYQHNYPYAWVGARVAYDNIPN